MYCYHHRISSVLIWNYFPELRELEVKRDAFEIPNEESITAYYKIRQQLKRLGNDMLVSIRLCCQKFVRALLKGKSVWFFSFFFFFQSFIHQPKFCLPFMQPGRLIQVKMVQIVGVHEASAGYCHESWDSIPIDKPVL